MLRVIAVVLLVALLLSMGVAALAQEGGDPATDPDSPAGEIIPEPNSGRAPEEAGDRGGSLQLAILALVGLAILGMAAHVVRQSSAARAARVQRAAERADATRQ
jgi:uncharacterized protein HemX